MNTLVLDIDFTERGNSTDYTLDGWGAPEPDHRWSIGQQSRIVLPVSDCDADYTLILRAQPWRAPPHILHQTLMLGANDRLLATVAMGDDAALAFDLPPPARGAQPGYTLSIAHLDSARSARHDTYRDGQSMGLLMRRMRLVRRTPRAWRRRSLPPLPGTLADGALVAAVERATGQPIATVLARFESLGQWCFLAALQVRYGAPPLGLLRYAGLHTPDLAEGLFRAFEGIGQAADLTAFHPAHAPADWDVHESRYRVWWHTGRTVVQSDAASILAFEQKRLPFLQRKFAETLSDGDRAFVLNLDVPAPERLAVYHALCVWGDNTLVFACQSGAAPPGTVEWAGPGLLRAHIDSSAEEHRGSDEAWMSVLANAYILLAEAEEDAQVRAGS